MSGCSPFEFVLLVLMHQGATLLQIKKTICEGVVIRSLQREKIRDRREEKRRRAEKGKEEKRR